MSEIEKLSEEMKLQVKRQGYEVSPYMLEYYMDIALKVVRLINKSAPSNKDMTMVLNIVHGMYELIAANEEIN